MLTDAHCHPFDINIPDFEKERRRLNVMAATSAYNSEEFTFNENLSYNAALDNAPPLFSCFGIHPQFFKIMKDESVNQNEIINTCNGKIAALETLAAEGRIIAIGECGFDLFNSAFKETESLQDHFFDKQIDIAVQFKIPVVLHVRRAMQKIFSLTKNLSKCKAVIFHSWSGTLEEGQALLRRGINAYFSFGNTIILNHRQAMRSCAFLPAEKLLTETDAPYQPRRGQKYSQWADLPLILDAAAALRNEAGNKTNTNELELQIENNFRSIFLKPN